MAHGVPAAETLAPLPDSPSTPIALPWPAAPRRPAVSVLEDFRARAAALTLADVVGIALQSSPVTRETWARARSAEADARARRSAYYPDLDLTANVTREKPAAIGGRSATEYTTYGPGLELTYLLLDFGGRAGDAQAGSALLHAAGWVHNAAIQDVVLEVQQSYYQYLDAKAQLGSADVNVKEAEANLEAANVRKRAGVATVADVLQAKTALSQAQLLQQGFAGSVHTLLGALATSMGLPANTAIDVGVLPDAPPLDAVGSAVNDLIDTALGSRPDLAAAREQAEAFAGRVRSARGASLPTLELAGVGNHASYLPSGYAASNNNGSLALLFRFPIFNGFAKESNLRKAQQDQVAAEAHAERIEQQVVFEVWRSFYDVETSANRVRTSQDLLASANESEQVALARYREGVGSILDLLTAQSALALARAQEIEARSDWFVSVAQLAHAVGVLGPAVATKPLSGDSNAR